MNDISALTAALEAAHARVGQLAGALAAARAEAKAAERALRRALARPAPPPPAEPPGLFTADGRAAFSARVEVVEPDGRRHPPLPRDRVPVWYAVDAREEVLLGMFPAATRESALARAIEVFPAVPPASVAVRESFATTPAQVQEEMRRLAIHMPGPVPELKREEVQEELDKAGIDTTAAEARVREALQARAEREAGPCTPCPIPDGPACEACRGFGKTIIPGQGLTTCACCDGWGKLPAVQEAVMQESSAGILSWDAPCSFTVTLADGQVIACQWEPDGHLGQGLGMLTLRGHAVDPSGQRQMSVGQTSRSEPLPEAARRWAQAAADNLAAQAAKPVEGAKEPARRKRKPTTEAP